MTRNQSNDTTDLKNRKTVLILIFSTVSQKSLIKKVYILRIRCGHEKP